MFVIGLPGLFRISKMKNIEKIREGLYVKKSFDGYRVIYPARNDDGSMNWFNLLTGGSYWNIIKVSIVVLMLLGLSWSYARDIRVYREITERIARDPYSFCINITSQQQEFPIDLNFTLAESLVNKGVENDKS